MSNPAGNVRGVVALKRALKTSWRLENELRFSAWDALPFEKISLCIIWLKPGDI